MRTFSVLIFVSALALEASADDYYSKFGNMFYTGPTTVDNVYITKVTYSMVPPSVPQCGFHTGVPQEELSLWCGVQPRGDDVESLPLVQPLLNWAPNQSLTGCTEATDDQWCVAASVYDPAGQAGQPYVAVPKDSQLDFEIAINESTTKIDQRVWVEGELVSYLSTNAGMLPVEFYSGNECISYSCGTLNGYSWSNITIHLSGADVKYSTTLMLAGATTTGLVTSDGGKTWHMDEVKINKDYFYQDGSESDC